MSNNGLLFNDALAAVGNNDKCTFSTWIGLKLKLLTVQKALSYFTVHQWAQFTWQGRNWCKIASCKAKLVSKSVVISVRQRPASRRFCLTKLYSLLTYIEQIYTVNTSWEPKEMHMGHINNSNPKTWKSQPNWPETQTHTPLVLLLEATKHNCLKCEWW